MSQRKPMYFCVPYQDHPYTMVYAGTEHPHTDGYIICLHFRPDGRPYIVVDVIDGERSESVGA